MQKQNQIPDKNSSNFFREDSGSFLWRRHLNAAYGIRLNLNFPAAFENGKKRVEAPAIGKIAFLIFKILVKNKTPKNFKIYEKNLQKNFATVKCRGFKI